MICRPLIKFKSKNIFDKACEIMADNWACWMTKFDVISLFSQWKWKQGGGNRFSFPSSNHFTYFYYETAHCWFFLTMKPCVIHKNTRRWLFCLIQIMLRCKIRPSNLEKIIIVSKRNKNSCVKVMEKFCESLWKWVTCFDWEFFEKTTDSFKVLFLKLFKNFWEVSFKL